LIMLIAVISEVEECYFAMGSGVTPNHASSVIQMPWS
jgi:hypothetical protein